MPIYKNSPEKFVNFRKEILLRALPVCVMAFTFGVIILYFTNSKDNAEVDWYVWPFVLLFLIATLGYGVFRAIKQQREIYYSYNLTIDTDNLSRQQSNLPALTLFFNEITQITENKKGDLIIKGQKIGYNIIVSPFLENYSEVRSLLTIVHPITQQPIKNIFQKYTWLLSLITVGSMAVVYISNNKIAVALCGIIVISMLIWSFYKIRTTPQIDNRTKRFSWWIIVVLISIIAIVYNKVFGI